MKKILLSIILMFTFVLAACTGGSAANTKAEEADTGSAPETAAEDMETEAAGTGEIDILAIMADSAILAMDRNLYVEYELYSEGETANMTTYFSPDMMRVDTDPDSAENMVAVYDVKANTAFFYIPSEGYGAELSTLELFDELDYESEVSEYADDIVNVKRTTLNGWDVIYGEAEVDGGQTQFWYSEEYATMMKYVVLTPEGEEMYLAVTDIEMPDTLDPKLFEKPESISFFDLGDTSGTLPDGIFGE